jgi:hypothetical protein
VYSSAFLLRSMSVMVAWVPAKLASALKTKKSVDRGIVSPAEMTPRTQTGTVQKVGGNICQTAAINEHEDGATGTYGFAGVTLNNCYPHIPNAFDPLLFLRRLSERRDLRDCWRKHGCQRHAGNDFQESGNF